MSTTGIVARPKFRWFQWRLSTWLVLVAIAAWAMATRPVVHLEHGANGNEDRFALQIFAGFLAPTSTSGIKAGWCLTVDIPKQSVWPVLALLAFLAWKLAWRVAERRRERGKLAP